MGWEVCYRRDVGVCEFDGAGGGGGGGPFRMRLFLEGFIFIDDVYCK